MEQLEKTETFVCFASDINDDVRLLADEVQALIDGWMQAYADHIRVILAVPALTSLSDGMYGLVVAITLEATLTPGLFERENLSDFRSRAFKRRI